MKEDESALLSVSGMGELAELQERHKGQRKGGLFYREVPCGILKKVVDLVKMDMELFQYSEKQYLLENGVDCEKF